MFTLLVILSQMVMLLLSQLKISIMIENQINMLFFQQLEHLKLNAMDNWFSLKRKKIHGHIFQILLAKLKTLLEKESWIRNRLYNWENQESKKMLIRKVFIQYPILRNHFNHWIVTQLFTLKIKTMKNSL